MVELVVAEVDLSVELLRGRSAELAVVEVATGLAVVVVGLGVERPMAVGVEKVVGTSSWVVVMFGIVVMTIFLASLVTRELGTVASKENVTLLFGEIETRTDVAVAVVVEESVVSHQ